MSWVNVQRGTEVRKLRYCVVILRAWAAEACFVGLVS